VQVAATDPSGVDSVYIQGVMAKRDTGSAWVSTVTLGQPNGAPMKVVVKAWDKLKNPSVDSTSGSITRNVPSGTDKPSLTLLQPSSNVGNALPFTSDTLHVVYKITDLVPLDTTTFLFGTVVPKRLTDSTWAADVPVPATAQPFTITIQIANTNKAGSVDQIVVIRAKDTVPPSIVRGPGASSHAVVFDSTSTTFSWTVSDNYRMGSISLNGAAIPVTPTVTVTKPLAVGVNPFVLVATDSFGNSAKDSIAITRGGDVTPPTVVSNNGTSPVVVPNATTTYTASWKVTDDVKMGAVTISDTAVTGTSNIFSLMVHLKVGTRKVGILAFDSAGNKSTDTVVVIRSAAAPAHSSPTGNYIGTVYDTLTSPGADSIEVSTNGTDWTKFSGVVTVSGNGQHTVYGRAWPGGALSSASFAITQISKIAVGTYHAAIVKTDGSLWMTGKNTYGQLGTGDNIDVSSPVQILSSGAASVAAGNNHTLVLKKDGSLYGTGFNQAGELGNGSTANLTTLVQVANGVSSVYAGLEHSLYITSGGALAGSGINNMGQMGTSAAPTYTSFRQIDSGVVSAAAGQYHTMYLKGNGQLYGCGANTSGQLGRTDTTTQWSPVLLDSNVSGISAGWNFSLRAKSSNTTLWGTGDDQNGQLGNGSYSNVYTPIQITLGPILSMATGWSHSLVVTSDGSLYVMGDNAFGEIGCGSSASVASPTKIMSGVAQVFGGAGQSFVLKTDGTLWVTGRSTSGELGIGSITTLYAFQRLNF
jgi:alpha-tubulin suppressor-like RCC1 family protein